MVDLCVNQLDLLVKDFFYLFYDLWIYLLFSTSMLTLVSTGGECAAEPHSLRKQGCVL